MSCKCQICGKPYMVDLNIPDNLWLRIQPPAKGKYAGLLCPTCIIGRIEMLHLVQDGDAQYGAYFLSPESQQKIKEENKNSAAIALAIDRFQELAGKNVEAEFSVGEIIDTLEEIAQEPCPDGEHNNEREEICPFCAGTGNENHWVGAGKEKPCNHCSTLFVDTLKKLITERANVLPFRKRWQK